LSDKSGRLSHDSYTQQDDQCDLYLDRSDAAEPGDPGYQLGRAGGADRAYPGHRPGRKLGVHDQSALDRFVLGGSAAKGSGSKIFAVRLVAHDRPVDDRRKDTIFARKILMGAIDMNMDEIETMLLPEGKLDLNDAQEHAETISTMLMAFPHMFPMPTNQWKAGAERDPAFDTFAAPELWMNFADFYARTQEASKIAWSASRAKKGVDLKPLIGELRAHCNACHALYMKTD
jgi:cytochrome c556